MFEGSLIVPQTNHCSCRSTLIFISRHWRLNERMYGALQGLNKAETAAKYGEKQVKVWRRSYSIRPPPVEPSDERWPGHEEKYKVTLSFTGTLKLMSHFTVLTFRAWTKP